MKQKMIVLVLIGIFCLPTLIPEVSEQSLAVQNVRSTEETYLIRIDTTKGQIELPDNTEIVSGQPGESLDVLMDKVTLSQLTQQNLEYRIMRSSNYEINTSTVESYPTFQEIENHLLTVATNYPMITDLFSIGQSYENRNLWCLEISNNPGIDEQEPEVLFMGLHHAREWPTVSITLSIIDKLVESYGENTTITDLVNNRRIWIIPCVNPDGYYYDHDLFNGGKWWRKNRHYFPEFSVYGVDLNRNYGGSCNGDLLAMWGTTGISHHPESELYCGAEPFSELEVQHVKQFFLNHTIDASISWHTYGELVLWPWGYSTEEQAPDEDTMSQIGIHIAENITQMGGFESYHPSQSSGLYPTTGDTTDWFYGYSHYVLGRPHFAYTIEACDEFHPYESYLEQICKENVKGAMVLLQEAERISQEPRRVISPLVTNISICENNSLQVMWQEQNPNAHLKKLAVQQLEGYTLFVDQVSEENTYWELSDFTVSNFRAHSGVFSYHSHVENEKVSAMTSSNPLFVTPGMNLSFWCYYEIEEDYDYAFLELSTNGRSFSMLDSFTGFSDEWEYKEYDLQQYQGKSIYIRFRYFTDKQSKEAGFWVDDIYPVSTFESTNVTSENISTTPFYLLDIPDDTTSFFRIRAYNDDYQWGDYGQLYQLSEFTGNSIPTVPVINGETKGKTEQTYVYTLQSFDQDQDDVYYQIQWGDGNQSEWLGPHQSGDSISVEHSWTKDGTYSVMARAKDTNDAISDWGDLQVQMPYLIKYPFFYRLQQIVHWILSFS